jgi:hypothetical protein
MQKDLSESGYEDDFMDEHSDNEYPVRHPSRDRRKLEEYLEQKRLKQYLQDDYDYDLDMNPN